MIAFVSRYSVLQIILFVKSKTKPPDKPAALFETFFCLYVRILCELSGNKQKMKEINNVTTKTSDCTGSRHSPFGTGIAQAKAKNKPKNITEAINDTSTVEL